MGKTPDGAVDSVAANLRSIPSVDRILSTSEFVTLASEFGRERVKNALTDHLQTVRVRRAAYDARAALTDVGERIVAATSPTLRRVINATGVIIHTNLGRAPIDPSIWSRAGEIVSSYSNLEFDLEAGERGRRDQHLSALCRTLFGCEAAVLANNNAAGTLLLLAAVAAKKEVVVSRGELVEIGGGFRVPEVIQQGGAKLHEVGTTNRTRARDYAEAVTRKTAAVLRVHRSNFDIVGFTETPSVEELVTVSREKRVPMLYDEGSGRVVDLSTYGFARVDTIRELIAKGVDAITCSTDKLIGATQGGLVLGREEIVSKVRRHPLMRALRAGKESYAIIGETLRSFATARYETEILIYRMLSLSLEQLRERAGSLIVGTRCEIVETRSALGGGTTPTETIPSLGIAMPGNPNDLYARFLTLPVPIVGRIEEDRFLLDVRTMLEPDTGAVREAIQAV